MEKYRHHTNFIGFQLENINQEYKRKNLGANNHFPLGYFIGGLFDKQRHTFQMSCMREHINHRGFLNTVAVSDQLFCIAH